MPCGCFLARIPSASSPSSGSGAWRNSSSASSAETRAPARTLSVSSRILSIVELHVAVEMHQIELARVAVEGLQSLPLIAPKKVPNIIAQVLAGDGLARRIAGVVVRGDGIRLRDALITRPLER